MLKNNITISINDKGIPSLVYKNIVITQLSWRYDANNTIESKFSNKFFKHLQEHNKFEEITANIDINQ
jgi:hypothetical protein